jgi:hypothetical protein
MHTSAEYTHKISEHKIIQYQSNINNYLDKSHDIIFIKSICVDNIDDIISLEITSANNIRRINSKYVIDLNRELFGSKNKKNIYASDQLNYIVFIEFN